MFMIKSRFIKFFYIYNTLSILLYLVNIPFLIFITFINKINLGN